MKKKLFSAIALMTCFTSLFGMTACGGGGGTSEGTSEGGSGNTIAVNPLTAAELGEGFQAQYLPDKSAIKQYSGKIDIALDFEGTVKGWEALAAEYERLQGNGVDVNVITTYSGSTYTSRLNNELTNPKTDWDIVEGNLGYGSTRKRCVDMYPSISSYNPYCGTQTMWSSVLEPVAYKTKEADNSGESYIMNSEIMQTCWFINDEAFDAAVAQGYLNAASEAAYPITWNDLISLCDYMQKAGYSNPLGITLCDASIESLQFTWLLRVYGDYYYRQFYEYIMAGEVGSSWSDYSSTAKVPEALPTYGVQWAKLLNIMFDKDCSFGKGYAGMTSEVYLDFVGNLAKMKGYLMKDVSSTEFTALRDEFETQSDGKSSPQIVLDYQGFGINYVKSDKIELGYFDYPQMMAGKYTKGNFEGEDIVDNENTITRDIGGNGGFLSVINHTDKAQNELNKDFMKFVLSPYGQTVYYKGLAAAGEVPKGLSSVKNNLVVIPNEWKAFFAESNKTITFNGDVDANPFLGWGVRYANGYTETQKIIRENWRNLLMTGLAADQALTPAGFASKWETAVNADMAEIIAFNGWPNGFWKDPSYVLG